MTHALAKRIDKLEAIGKSVVCASNVLHVRRDETTADALARFAEANPNVPPGHRLLIVPARDRTAEDDADFEARFKSQQEQLIANARSGS